MDAIILIRVSTQQQDFEQQKSELISYAHQLGYDNYFIISDKESGVKLTEEERNGIIEMKSMIDINKDIKGVIVYELSRLSRRQDVLHSLKEWFINTKINLHIYDKKYNLLNPDYTLNEQCDLLYTLYGYFCESEAKQTKMRSKRGKEYWRLQGKFVGGRIVYGYTTDSEGYIIPNEEELKIVKYLFNKYITTDITIRQLGKELLERGYHSNNLRSAASWVKCILTNYAYAGQQSNYSPKAPLIYPPTIPKEWIDKVHKKLSQSLFLPRTTDNVYYCKSLLKSSENVNLIASVTDVTYYTQKPYKYISCNINVADAIVWHCVRRMIYPIYVMNNSTQVEQELNAQLNINNEKLTTINKKDLELSNELKRIKHLYIKGKLTDEEFEALESENIKNKGILISSKRLLEENNTNILQMIKNAGERFKISLIDISHLNDENEIKKIIDMCVQKIILTRDGDILTFDIISFFGLNYVFKYNVKKCEIYFLDEKINIFISCRFKNKRKRTTK